MIAFFKFPLEDSLGGAEFHTLRLAQHFLAMNKIVKLFSSDRKLIRLFREHDIPTQYVFAGWEPTSITALFLWPITYFIARKKLKKILKTIPTGSVFFMQSLIEKLILTPLLTTGYQLQANPVWIEHKTPGRWLSSNPLLSRYLKLAPEVQIITVSNFARNEFVKLGVSESNIQLIYPGVEAHLKLRLPHPEHFTIGLFSRLDPEKGVLDFLRKIMPQLPKYPRWRIVIAGEGRNENEIQSLAGEHNQVEILGFINDLDTFFSRISVLVYPSRVPESFGISVLEAQSRGIPVIASDLGALPEIIENGKTGFLAKPDNFKQIMGHLEVLRDPDFAQKMGNKAAKKAQGYTLSGMLEGFEKIAFQNR